MESSLFWKISDKILFPFLFSPLTCSPRQDMGVGSARTKDPKEEEECEGAGRWGGVLMARGKIGLGGLGGNRYPEPDKWGFLIP